MSQLKKDTPDESNPMDSLLKRLNDRSSPQGQFAATHGSIPITPATDECASTPPTELTDPVLLVDASEILKLRQDLQMARNEVTRMSQEMHSQQMTRATMEHLTQSSETDYSYAGDITEQTLTQLQNRFNASTRNNNGWDHQAVRPGYGTANSFGSYQAQPRLPIQQSNLRRNGPLNEPTHFPLDQSFRNNGMNLGMSGGMNSSFTSAMGGSFGNGLSNPPSRPDSAFDPLYDQYSMSSLYGHGQLAPIGTMANRLSPDAAEFNAPHGIAPSPWNSQVFPPTQNLLVISTDSVAGFKRRRSLPVPSA